MRIVDICEAKARLSQLVDQAAAGDGFIIARGGRPMVKVVPIHASEGGQVRRLGFLEGQIAVPDDFDAMGTTEIHSRFDDAS